MRSNKVLQVFLSSVNGGLTAILRGVAVVFLLAVLGVAGVALNDLVGPGADSLAQNAAEKGSDSGSGWGAESISKVGQYDLHVPLIPLANACGLGASSCYKCHNGKRAEAAGPEAWHTDHETVNNSCASCHGGNPRIMVERMAHNKMEPNPITNPGKYCYECHQESDRKGLVEAYTGLLNGGEEE